MTSSGVLSVDLSAIQDNWRAVRSRCELEVDVAAVIKANAYGLGAREVGLALYEAGCREFFFANIAEAIEFRSYDLSGVLIYVLGGVRVGDEQLFTDSGIVPIIFSYESALRWAAIRERESKPLPCVIKINTGMTRLGLSANELEALCANPDFFKKLNPVMVMSHLACADEPLHPLNHEQLKVFRECISKAREIIPKLRFSLANSSGVFLGRDWHFDLLRPGAALYGINPVPGEPNPLRQVLHLSLPILQVRRLSSASSVGYGASVKLPPNSRLAVVAGGYADGLHRTLGIQPEGMLCGQRIQSVGRVSMDLTVFDITSVDLSDEEVMKHSIDVINDELTLDYLTKKNNALGYEILTSLGYRYKRIYKGGCRGQ